MLMLLDCLAGPGPSSIAAAAASSAASITDHRAAIPAIVGSSALGVDRLSRPSQRRHAPTTNRLPGPAAAKAALISPLGAEKECPNRPRKSASRHRERGKARSKEAFGGSRFKEAELSHACTLGSDDDQAHGGVTAWSPGSRTGSGSCAPPREGGGESRLAEPMLTPSALDVVMVPATGVGVSTASFTSIPGTRHPTEVQRNRPVKSILDLANAAHGGVGSRGSRNCRSSTPTGVIEGVNEDAAVNAVEAGCGTGASILIRLPDGRQLVKVVDDTPSAAAASALSHALGVEQRAMVRFDGGAGALKGLRTLTLAHMFMAGYQRALSFVVDVKQAVHVKRSPLDERPQSGDVSFMYRVMARTRSLAPYDNELPAAIRQARFLLDLSINVRQAWDMKGDVDEEQAYDLADTLYSALLARQAEKDSELLRQRQQQEYDKVMDVSHSGGGNVLDPDLSINSQLDHVRVDLVRGRPGSQSTHHKRGSGRRQHEQQQKRQEEELSTPWIIVTADLGQGPTMLTALGLLQKRLREERQKVVVEATLYRASVAAPRLNAKDGWVYVIGLGFEAPYLPRHGYRKGKASSSSP
ncbi:hypothetical protein Vretifemale_17874 [Volvox reticuliferus]|uniref:Uncharacterized protein n=2 Tax=Volvox reticuliferus TaxID=1737510 RepID=A0A8J4CW67_9CHLO|nr:hypothetical protein Vretifemale_17874 [Volvox reticuliferus]